MHMSVWSAVIATFVIVTVTVAAAKRRTSVQKAVAKVYGRCPVAEA